MAVLSSDSGGTKGGYKPPKKPKILGVKKPKKGDSEGGWTEIKPTLVKPPKANEPGSGLPVSFKFDDLNVDTSRVNVVKRGGRIPPMSDWDALMLKEVRSQAKAGWDAWREAHPGMAPKVKPWIVPPTGPQKSTAGSPQLARRPNPRLLRWNTEL